MAIQGESGMATPLIYAGLPPLLQPYPVLTSAEFTFCLEVLKGLLEHEHGWVFALPVDPVQLDLPNYFDIIKNPMDLFTTRKKLVDGFCCSVDNFHSDVNLTFDNAMR